jgi:hypothetical protein
MYVHIFLPVFFCTSLHTKCHSKFNMIVTTSHSRWQENSSDSFRHLVAKISNNRKYVSSPVHLLRRNRMYNILRTECERVGLRTVDERKKIIGCCSERNVFLEQCAHSILVQAHLPNYSF